MSFRYNYYGPLEIDRDGLERMGAHLRSILNKVSKHWDCNMTDAELESVTQQECINLIKAYHGIPQT